MRLPKASCQETRASESLRYRARGALLGLGIGDAMGAPVENLSAADIRARFGDVRGFLTDEVSGTDDTEYAVFIAQLLLRHGHRLTVEDVVRAYREQLLHRRVLPGAGFSELGTLENLRRGWEPPLSGSHAHSWSDGVAMRAAVHGVWARGDARLAAESVTLEAQVCAHSEGVWAGVAVAVAVTTALCGADADAVLQAALDAVPPESWTAAALESTRRAVDADQALDAVVCARYPWTDLGPEAVALAVWAAWTTDLQPASAIPLAVSLGRDADTIAAIAGAVSGAAAGEAAIPADWRARLGPVSGRCLGDVVADVELGALAEELIGADA